MSMLTDPLEPLAAHRVRTLENISTLAGAWGQHLLIILEKLISNRYTIVLVHGHSLECHGGIRAWYQQVLGDPPLRPGRIACGMLATAHEDADLTIWGSGATERDGQKESEWTKSLMLKSFDDQTHEEHGFGRHFKGINLQYLRNMMVASMTDKVSGSTADEIKFALDKFSTVSNDVIKRLVLVTSGSHAPRSLTLASDQIHCGKLDIELQAHPSRICFSKLTCHGTVEETLPSDTKNLEVTHFGRPLFLNRLVDALLRLPKDCQEKIVIKLIAALMHLTQNLAVGQRLREEILEGIEAYDLDRESPRSNGDMM
jgi:hypothetical protein